LLLIPLVVLGALLFRRPDTPNIGRVPDRGLGAGIAPETPPAPLPRLPEVTPPRLPEALSQPEAPQPPAKPPAAQRLAEAPASAPVVAELSQFLEGSGGEPSRRFAFDDLNFEFATTDMTSSSLATLDHLAQLLKAHPTAEVVVEGYTDDIGLPAANERLSLQRAEAVKNALVARGADADRITTRGLGQEQPRASNDTAEGRAQNRRTELVVKR
jgi:OmpA-OmpF porin, OOP family